MQSSPFTITEIRFYWNILYYSTLCAAVSEPWRFSYLPRFVRVQDEGITLQTAAQKPHGGIALYKNILSNALSEANVARNPERASGEVEKSEPLQRRLEEEEIRRERKEMYENVLKGDFDDLTLRQIDNYIENVTPNNRYWRPLSQRLPSQALRRVHEGERAGAVDVLFSRICESAVPKNGRAGAEGKRRIEEKKKELLKGWAIATGNWHTSVNDFTDAKEPLGRGKDSNVYQSDDGKSVIKVSAGKENLKKFRPDIDAVALFNSVFPESQYRVLGFGEVDGKFVKFLEQPFVDFAQSTPLSAEERTAYMKDMGFEPINKESTAFSNGTKERSGPSTLFKRPIHSFIFHYLNCVMSES